MNTWTRLIALPAVFLPLAVLAQDNQMSSDAESAAVEALKASVRKPVEVDTVRMTDAGVACITYRTPTETGGETRAHAVVDGEKVLRSSIGNTRFEKAWKEKCVGAGS